MPCSARIFVKDFVKDAQPQLDGRALGHALRLERALVVERLAAVVEALLVLRQAGALVDARLELAGSVARQDRAGCGRRARGCPCGAAGQQGVHPAQARTPPRDAKSSEFKRTEREAGNNP